MGSATVAWMTWPDLEDAELSLSAEVGVDDPGGGIDWFCGGFGGECWRWLRVNVQRGCCFDCPGCALLNALRMIGKLGVEKLGEAVALVGGSEEGELVAQHLDAVVELLMDEASLAGRRWDEAVDGRSVSGGSGDDGQGGSVVEQDSGEADHRDVEAW